MCVCMCDDRQSASQLYGRGEKLRLKVCYDNALGHIARRVSSCRNDCHIDLSKQPPAGTGNLRVFLSSSSSSSSYPQFLFVFLHWQFRSRMRSYVSPSLSSIHIERKTVYASFTVTLMAFRQETASISLHFFSSKKAAPNFPILRHIAYLCMLQSLLPSLNPSLFISLSLFLYSLISLYFFVLLTFSARI